ncbi:MAG: PAS domain S-box protein [Candidatus Omnitrophica bacterium]|nr:PAS domain S-box protein [Candidatus Omnitrophota bacterium]
MKNNRKEKPPAAINEEDLRLKNIALEAVKRSYETAKAELAETKQTLETIVNGITDGILLISKDFKIIWANKAMLKKAGCLSEEIIGKHCHEITHKRNSPCVPPNDICPIREVLRTGKSTAVTHTHFDRQNNRRFVEVTAYPIKNKSGEVFQYVHIERDITERKKAEEALINSESIYRTIFNSVNDAIIIHDGDNLNIVEINKRGSEMLLSTSEEMKGMGIEKLLCDEEGYTREKFSEFFRKASQDEPQTFEWKLKDKAGRCFWVDIGLKRAIIHGNHRIIAVIRDISDRKQ